MSTYKKILESGTKCSPIIEFFCLLFFLLRKSSLTEWHFRQPNCKNKKYDKLKSRSFYLENKILRGTIFQKSCFEAKHGNIWDLPRKLKAGGVSVTELIIHNLSIKRLKIVRTCQADKWLEICEQWTVVRQQGVDRYGTSRVYTYLVHICHIYVYLHI